VLGTAPADPYHATRHSISCQPAASREAPDEHSRETESPGSLPHDIVFRGPISGKRCRNNFRIVADEETPERTIRTRQRKCTLSHRRPNPHPHNHRRSTVDAMDPWLEAEVVVSLVKEDAPSSMSPKHSVETPCQLPTLLWPGLFR
jgi:hypothetical protein